jgi:hypothetical protein
MAQHPIAEAASLVNRDRRTLYKDIKRGRLTATTSATGERQVETSELIRVYGNLLAFEATQATVARAQKPTALETSGRQAETSEFIREGGDLSVFEATRATVARAQKPTALETARDAEIALLREKVEALEARLEDKQLHIEHLAQAMRLLEHRPGAELVRRSWWRFGRK